MYYNTNFDNNNMVILLILCSSPNDCDYPADKSPAEEKIEKENCQRIALFSYNSNYGGQKIECQADNKNYNPDKAAEKEF
jgi:hypothetical protein